MAGNWYDNMQEGSNNRRRREAEDVAASRQTTLWNEQQVAKARLEKMRQLNTQRVNPDIGDFAGKGGATAPGSTTVAPEWDASQAPAITAEGNQAVANANVGVNAGIKSAQSQSVGNQAALDKLRAFETSQRTQGYDKYLPEQKNTTIGNSRAQMLSDAELDDELSRAATALDMDKGYQGVSEFGAEVDYVPDVIGDVGGNIADWYNNASEADKAKRDTTRVIRDWFKPGITGPSQSESYFRNNPGEWDKAKLDLEGYYNTIIEPQLASGGLKDVPFVHTKEQIATAKAEHTEYLGKLKAGINTLEDNVNNAAQFVKEANTNRVSVESDIRKIYKNKLTASDAKQLAKTANVSVDAAKLDPSKLTGLVAQSYEQRKVLLFKAQTARSVAEISGNWEAYDALRAQIAEKDVGIYAAIGHQGISELTMNKDPSRISAVLSHFANAKMIIQPRSDGMYNVISNGAISGKPQTANGLKSLVQMYSSPTFRAQSMANTQAQVEQQIKGKQTQSEAAKNASDMTSNLLVEQQKGMNEVQKQAQKAQFEAQGWKFSSTGDGSGAGFFTTTDGKIVAHNPNPAPGPSGIIPSMNTDVTSQFPAGASDALRFNKQAFWKSIGLSNPLNK